jgi:hypothetical protein
MIETIVKLSGSILVAGVGMALFGVSFLFTVILISEIYNHWRYKE